MQTRAAELALRARRFREAYGQHRAAEGRNASKEDMLALPFLESGPLAQQWRVRAHTFNRFMTTIVAPRSARLAGRVLRVADLGAGNGWLCYRLALAGHAGLAIDVRADAVDGLGAAAVYDDHLGARFPCIVASFESLPLHSGVCDVAVFNASLHYALDLRAALAEAARIVEPGGHIAILDSPFYRDEQAGAAMVAEKRANAEQQFGALAEHLMGLSFVEYLTRSRLADASQPLGLEWRRYRVLYPLWYEARPLLAQLRGQRAPSRFDLWEAIVP